MVRARPVKTHSVAMPCLISQYVGELYGQGSFFGDCLANCSHFQHKIWRFGGAKGGSVFCIWHLVLAHFFKKFAKFGEFAN